MRAARSMNCQPSTQPRIAFANEPGCADEERGVRRGHARPVRPRHIEKEAKV